VDWSFEDDDDAESSWEIADDHVTEVWFDDDEDARWAVPGIALAETAQELQESPDEDDQSLGEVMDIYARAAGVRTGAENRPILLAAIERWASRQAAVPAWARQIIDTGGRSVPFGPRRRRRAPGGSVTDLWDENDTTLAAEPVRFVGTADIDELLDREPELAFVVTGIGEPLDWIRGERRRAVWEEELAPHLVEPGTAAELQFRNGFPVERYTETEWWRPDGASIIYRLDDYPDGYVYVAVEWRLDTGEPVVVAMKHH
jgi:hypothetical protein